jgi:hypothetical protein
MKTIFTTALLAPLLHSALILQVEAAVPPVRGVNLGGWFVLEPWYVSHAQTMVYSFLAYQLNDLLCIAGLLRRSFRTMDGGTWPMSGHCVHSWERIWLAKC